MSTLQLTDPPLTERLEKRPPGHWLVDLGTSPLYPADTKAWLPDVRGYDGPTRQFMKHAEFHANTDHGKCRTVISFHTNDDRDAPVLVSGTFLEPIVRRDEKPSFRCLEAQWLSNSQVPCLRIKITRGAGKAPAFVWIFARDMRPVATVGEGCKLACVHMLGSHYDRDTYPGTGIDLDPSRKCTV
jgi:hypothetical protein